MSPLFIPLSKSSEALKLGFLTFDTPDSKVNVLATTLYG